MEGSGLSSKPRLFFYIAYGMAAMWCCLTGGMPDRMTDMSVNLHSNDSDLPGFIAAHISVVIKERAPFLMLKVLFEISRSSASSWCFAVHSSRGKHGGPSSGLLRVTF